MKELFNDLVEKGRITDALIVGRNMFNKNPDDVDCFKVYIDLLLSLSDKLPSLEERKYYSSQAEMVLSFFEENTSITLEILETIRDYREKVVFAIDSIVQEENDNEESERRRIQAENNKAINKLYKTNTLINASKTEDEFNQHLHELSKIDGEIDSSRMTKEQEDHYNQLSKECTETISNKMKELEYKKNVDYNKKAVASFEDAFKRFKDDESKFKSKSELHNLVCEKLFAFNASRLFNETLIYYNHVYTYIFSKLSDEGKIEMTKASIECERKNGDLL